MKFSNDMIKSVLEDYLFDKDIYQDGKLQCGFDELVEGITIELNMISDIERQLRNIENDEQMLREEHKKTCDELQMLRDKLMSQCRHHSMTCQTDSSTTCDICGKDL